MPSTVTRFWLLLRTGELVTTFQVSSAARLGLVCSAAAVADVGHDNCTFELVRAISNATAWANDGHGEGNRRGECSGASVVGGDGGS